MGPDDVVVEVALSVSKGNNFFIGVIKIAERVIRSGKTKPVPSLAGFMVLYAK
jgi:hypothetical protein